MKINHLMYVAKPIIDNLRVRINDNNHGTEGCADDGMN